ncbi:ATP-binding cassette domain-containing protein [Rubrivivax albus]|uniref:ATP-binding cassette domain-containing protein n=2 Tax=Rubrivivax albus TaxID=2499835 RepID=A0A437JX09_9BURK|nr:ATP-binding cassette domain-containing protein [Rubrivivax albus]
MPGGARRDQKDMNVLSLKGVKRVAAGRTIVGGVDLAMGPTDVVALLGPSGSGKTSLLRMIAGFDAPDDGRVELDGSIVSAAGRVLCPPERRRVAVAFQDATLFPHLDAIGNAAFGIRTGSRAQRREAASAALAGMGLAAVDGRDVATLSGGEAQRVSLARALASDARLLLLDEPFGNVDRLTRADLVQRLRASLAAGRAAIIVTHDPADALELDARVLVMRDGKLVYDGSAQALLSGTDDNWAARFFRSGQAGVAR